MSGSKLGQEIVEKVGNLALSVWRYSESIIHTFIYYANIFEYLSYVRHCALLSLGNTVVSKMHKTPAFLELIISSGK